MTGVDSWQGWDFSFHCQFHTLVIAIWHVLRFLMDEKASRYGG
jgi:hypothetical protein